MLKATQVTVYEVNYKDLNDFIRKTYNNNKYEFVADHEAHNDTCYPFIVEKESFDEFDNEDLCEFVSGGGRCYITRILLTDLCNRDIIPAGKYIVKVSW